MRAHIRSLQSEYAADDSIADVSTLRKLRTRIANEGYTWFCKDINFNNCSIYGIWHSLFPDASIGDCLAYPSIEHGLFLYDYVFGDVYATSRPAVATFGDYRYEVLKKRTNLPVFRVGPYIQYSHNFYNQERIDQIHSENGRTLLVFPRHSTNDGSVSSDDDRHLSALHSEAKLFDHVLICCFWWNLNDPLIQRLEAEGYQLVSAGFRDDPQFLPRLKTIISMSDMAIGDSVGTHIGYCMQMGVQFHIVDMGSVLYDFDPVHCINARIAQTHEARIKAAFQTGSLKDQQVVMSYYFGGDILRTPSTMQTIAEICHDILKLTGGFKQCIPFAVKKLLTRYSEESTMLDRQTDRQTDRQVQLAA
jgi:hypothetical protein